MVYKKENRKNKFILTILYLMFYMNENRLNMVDGECGQKGIKNQILEQSSRKQSLVTWDSPG